MVVVGGREIEHLTSQGRVLALYGIVPSVCYFHVKCRDEQCFFPTLRSKQALSVTLIHSV